MSQDTQTYATYMTFRSQYHVTAVECGGCVLTAYQYRSQMVCEVVIAKTELAHIVLAKSINAPFISDREREVFSCCHSHVYWLRSLLYIPFTKKHSNVKNARKLYV